MSFEYDFAFPALLTKEQLSVEAVNLGCQLFQLPSTAPNSFNYKLFSLVPLTDIQLVPNANGSTTIVPVPQRQTQQAPQPQAFQQPPSAPSAPSAPQPQVYQQLPQQVTQQAPQQPAFQQAPSAPPQQQAFQQPPQQAFQQPPQQQVTQQPPQQPAFQQAPSAPQQQAFQQPPSAPQQQAFQPAPPPFQPAPPPQQAPPPFQQAPPPPSQQIPPPPFQEAPPPFQQAPPPFQQAPPPFQQAPPPFQQDPRFSYGSQAQSKGSTFVNGQQPMYQPGSAQQPPFPQDPRLSYASKTQSIMFSGETEIASRQGLTNNPTFYDPNQPPPPFPKTNTNFKPAPPPKTTSSSSSKCCCIIVLVLFIVILVIAGGVVGGVCGSGLCSSSPQQQQSLTSVYLKGTVVNANGSPLANAAVSAVGSSTTTTSSSTGTFTILAPVNSSSSTAAVQVTLSGYAPNIGTVALPDSVVQTHAVTVTLVPFTSQESFTMQSGVSTTVSVFGTSIEVSVSPGTVSSISSTTPLTLRVAVFSPSNGPGLLKTSKPTAQGNTALQTSGMFYSDVIVTSTQKIVQVPVTYSLVSVAVTNIVGAEEQNWYNADQNGNWANPTPITFNKRSAGFSAAAAAGFWNSDRAYKTACVVATITSTGSTCTGARVVATGPDNIASIANSNSQGSFCIEGAQTRPSTVSIGSATMSITFPSNPGSCSNPSSCLKVSSISVSSTSCPEPVTSTPTPGGNSACNLNEFESCSTPALNQVESACGSTGTVSGCCSASESFYNNCWVPYAEACLNNPQYQSDLQEIQSAYQQIFEECNIYI